MSKTYFGKAFKDDQGRIFIEAEKKIEVLWKISLLPANTKVGLKERDVYQCPQCNYMVMMNIDTRHLNESVEDRIIRYGYNYCHRCGHQNIIERD
jgi:DNA-directed RNA polymerase subunit RPC12/RpoP